MLKKHLSYLFQKLIQELGLNVDDYVRGAAQFDILNQVDPLVNVRAQLSHLDSHFVITTASASTATTTSLAHASRQLYQVLDAIEAI